MWIRVAKLIILKFWNLLECECNAQGSAKLSCNSDGICACKDNITGDKCDDCILGHFPFPDCNRGKIHKFCTNDIKTSV